MVLRVRHEGESEEVYELLLPRQRAALAVEEVPDGPEALGGRRQTLGHLAAAEVQVQPEVELQVRGRLVGVRNQVRVAPRSQEGVLVGAVEGGEQSRLRLAGHQLLVVVVVVAVLLPLFFAIDGDAQLQALAAEGLTALEELTPVQVLYQKSDTRLFTSLYWSISLRARLHYAIKDKSV